MLPHVRQRVVEQVQQEDVESQENEDKCQTQTRAQINSTTGMYLLNMER